jgi:hypothetical protein
MILWYRTHGFLGDRGDDSFMQGRLDDLNAKVREETSGKIDMNVY